METMVVVGAGLACVTLDSVEVPADPDRRGPPAGSQSLGCRNERQSVKYVGSEDATGEHMVGTSLIGTRARTREAGNRTRRLP